MAVFTEHGYMNGKQIPQLKKPTDSQEENYISLKRDTGFTAKGDRPFGGKQTFSLKNCNDSAPPAGKKKARWSRALSQHRKTSLGRGAGGGRRSYPASVKHMKRSQVSFCAFQPVGQPSPSRHQCSPGHPGALDVALIPLLLADRAAARVSPTTTSATLRQACSQAHTAHGGGEQWWISFSRQGWEIKMQTRLFGIILAGHIEKSSAFCIPAKQEMVSTGRASQLPLRSLCLKRKNFINPWLSLQDQRPRRHTATDTRRAIEHRCRKGEDKLLCTSPQAYGTHTRQRWHHREQTRNSGRLVLQTAAGTPGE